MELSTPFWVLVTIFYSSPSNLRMVISRVLLALVILLPHSFVNEPSLDDAIFIMLMFLLRILILHYCWTDIFAFISLWTTSPLFPLRTWLLHIGQQEVTGWPTQQLFYPFSEHFGQEPGNSPITSSTYQEFLKEHGSNVLGRTALIH